MADKKEDAKRRARLSRLRKKVKSGKASREDRAVLRQLESDAPPSVASSASASSAVEEMVADPPPPLESAAGGWYPAGGPAPSDALPPPQPPPQPPPVEEEKKELGEPPALPDAPVKEAVREVSPEEAERSVAVIGMMVAMGVAQTVESAKRLALAGKIPRQIAPLVLSCDEARTAAIAGVVAAATGNVLRKYGGGAVRYTDEAIVAVAVAASVAVNLAAAKLPPVTPEELAAAAEATAAIRAAEDRARASL